LADEGDSLMRVHVTLENVQAAFAQFKGRSVFAESSALADQGQMPVEMIQAMSLQPEVLACMASTGPIYPDGLLERNLKEKVILKSSIKNQCQFCETSHRALMGMIDIPQIQIDDLENPDHLTERERLALAYTEAVMTDSNRVPEDLFVSLKEKFSEPEIVELTFLIGFINLLNWFNNALQVTFHGEYSVSD
jgi:alkylhydroperoxidase family enzyme